MQIGFLGALTLLLIAFKLLGYINISWLLVLAPVWIPIFIVSILVIIYYYKHWNDKN